MRWQYHAMRVPSREWLDRDLPLAGVSLGPTLSGPYSLKATISPEFASLIAEDGDLVLAEWGTLLIAEADGLVRGAAIITHTEITGSVLSIEAAGITAHTAGQPYEGVKTWGGKSAGTTGSGVDPLDVVREMWAWRQAQPDGDLGVTLGATTTQYRLGAWHGARKLNDDGTLGPINEVNDPITFDGPLPIAKPTPARGKQTYWQYTLGWWDKVEIASRTDELARVVPFDYVETAQWTDAAKSDVDLGIRFGHPRIGAKRDLTFIEGENLAAPPTVKRGSDDYANHVTAIGAGEGSKQLRATVGRRDGRLRRVRLLEATDLRSTASLRALASDTLLRTRHLADITTLAVTNHPSAPVGSYGVGDDILVQTGPSWQPTRMWVRITALDLDPVTEVTTITCSRSDAWDYSGRSA